MVYSLNWKKAVIASLLMLLFASASIGTAAGADVAMFVTADNFDDYVTGTYTGSDGPGMWLQDLGESGSANYKIISSGGRTFYKLESSDAFFVKAILPYYFLILYIGPINYSVTASMKVDVGEGGIIFRVQPVKVGDIYYLRKYYLATVYKDSRKVALWYVDEIEGPGAGPRLALADIPESIDLDNWFSLNVIARGDNLVVKINNQELINVNDDRLSYGSIGLYTFKGCAASFDWINWIAYVPQATETVTTTITTTATGSASTVTSTVTEGTTVTTTATETGETTVTMTETTTSPAETVTETVTATQTTTEKETETKTVTETATSTLTSTVTEAGGLRCLIATAAFGSEIAPQVQALRNFRDGFVTRTFAGENFMKAFNAFYYSWSPYVAHAEYENPTLRDIVKTSIYPLLFSLDVSKQAAEPFSTIPELAVLISGLVAASLIGLIYVAPIVVSIFLILRWKGKQFNIKLLYPTAALIMGLILFALAEASASPLLMILASSTIVLSAMAFGAIAPAKIFSIWESRKQA